ncbi:hypothetical protein GBAR_LOCUS15739, partial [Geodia barretti]
LDEGDPPGLDESDHPGLDEGDPPAPASQADDGVSGLSKMSSRNNQERKRYLTRSRGEAPPFTKKICRGNNIF